MFLFIFETERGRAWGGEGQREKETQNPKRAPGSELSAQSLMWGSNSRTTRSWPGLKLNAEPPRRPCDFLISLTLRHYWNHGSTLKWFWRSVGGSEARIMSVPLCVLLTSHGHLLGVTCQARFSGVLWALIISGQQASLRTWWKLRTIPTNA